MKVFVINLRRSSERRDAMLRQLERSGTEFEFFDAVDGRALDAATLASVYSRTRTEDNLHRELSPGEIGCALSHRGIYRKMVEENIDRAVILEDDVTLDASFPEVCRFLERRPMRNEVVKLDNYQGKNTPCSIWHERRMPGGRRLRKPVTTQWMAWGYALDRLAAENILKTWPQIEFCADDWKRMGRAVKIRAVQPAVVLHNEEERSIIDDDRLGLTSHGVEAPKRAFARAARLGYLLKVACKMVMP